MGIFQIENLFLKLTDSVGPALILLELSAGVLQVSVLAIELLLQF